MAAKGGLDGAGNCWPVGVVGVPPPTRNRRTPFMSGSRPKPGCPPGDEVNQIREQASKDWLYLSWAQQASSRIEAGCTGGKRSQQRSSCAQLSTSTTARANELYLGYSRVFPARNNPNVSRCRTSLREAAVCTYTYYDHPRGPSLPRVSRVSMTIISVHSAIVVARMVQCAEGVIWSEASFPLT